MIKPNDLSNLKKILNNVNIRSWFELGEFLNNIRKQQKKIKSVNTFSDFSDNINKNGIAFITFEYGVGGVSTEIVKYIRVIKKIFPASRIHLIGGEFNEIFDRSLRADCEHFRVPEMTGFRKWKLYSTFYQTKIFPDTEIYQKSLQELWQKIFHLCNEIGDYLAEKKVSLLYTINTNSNPGNISLALALVILSELLNIPVINNNHDFFWESGRIGGDIKYKDGLSGSRDIYFTNHHLKEFFSILEMLYPWKSPSWQQLNINRRKSELLIKHHNFSEKEVSEIGTAVDLQLFKPIKERDRKKEIFRQLTFLFSGSSKQVKTIPIRKVISQKVTEPFIAGWNDSRIDFQSKHILLLQPTRIIERKRIEDVFPILSALVTNKNFCERFDKDNYRFILFLISGPLIAGHDDYYFLILNKFHEMLQSIRSCLREKIYLGFLFSSFDKNVFQKKYSKPLKIFDLFNISSLITLLSETEGRGLPIIEAAACQVSAIIRRYYPPEVCSQLIGENLPEDEMLKVIEYKDAVSSILLEDINSHLFEDKDLLHNRKAVENRYNFSLLERDIRTALEKLFRNLYYRR